MACNEYGPGRLAEPPAILAAIQRPARQPEARSPAATRWSPAARPTSRSTRCATSPTAAAAARATPSPPRWPGLARASPSSPARSPAGPAGRHHPPCRDRRGDAGGLRSRPAGGHRRLRRRGRGLADGPARRTQVEEAPGRRAALAGPGPQSGHPRHHRRARPGPAASRRRFRRRDGRSRRQRRGKAAPQGLRLDRRQRRLARQRHHGRRRERGALVTATGIEDWPRCRQGRRRPPPGLPHRGAFCA